MADITTVDRANVAAASDPPTYEELAQIELDFEDVDTEIIARQELLNLPIYTRRYALTRRIPHFWPLVFEEAPPEIDQHIQPSDSAIFAAALLDLHVARFETIHQLSPSTNGSVETQHFGEPRSLEFRFEFAPNAWFDDEVLTKRFWYRRARNGWAGRVSEPVRIRWKKGKDPTGGLLDAAVKLFKAEQRLENADATAAEDKGSARETQRPPEYETLRQKVERTTEGSQSFFTWFGYRGPHISAAESAEATRAHERKRQRQRQRQRAGHSSSSTSTDPNPTLTVTAIDSEDEDESTRLATEARFAADADAEVFPDGEELAISLAEELWPSATKYFVAAQEADDDAASSSSFEEEMEEELGNMAGDEEDEEDDEDDAVPDLRSLVRGDLKDGAGRGGSNGNGKDAGPPSKKRRM